MVDCCTDPSMAPGRLAVQLIDGGQVLLPGVKAAVELGLIDGGDVHVPSMTLQVATELLTGVLQSAVSLGTDQFLFPDKLEGDSLNLPELFKFVEGEFATWTIPPSQRRLIVKDAQRIWIID